MCATNFEFVVKNRMRLFLLIYFLLISPIQNKKEYINNMFKFVDSLVNSIIKITTKPSQKVKVIRRKKGGDSQQPSAKKRKRDQSFDQTVSQPSIIEFVNKINKELDYNAKMLKYLFENEVEFIVNGEDYDANLNGKIICVIKGYVINTDKWFDYQTMRMKKVPELKYTLQYRGYFPARSDNNNKFTQVDKYVWKDVSIYQNYNKFTASKNSKLEDILQYLKINFIKTTLNHTQKFKYFVAYTDDETLSIVSDVNNEIQKQISAIQQGKKLSKIEKYRYKSYEVKIDNTSKEILYYKDLPNAGELRNKIEYFNVCQGSEPVTNNQFNFIFNQDYFKTNHYYDNNKFINLNLLKISDKAMTIQESQYGNDFKSKIEQIHKNMKKKTIEVVKEFVKNDEANINNQLLMFISHNVQNKNGKEPKDEDSVEGVGLSNIFRQYSEMLFGQDTTSYNTDLKSKAFQFTKSMIILLQETNWLAIDTTIYGMGNVYFVNCDLANGSLFVYGNDNLLYGYNTFRSCKLDENQKDICKYIDINAISTTMIPAVSKNLQNCKNIYDRLKERYKKTKGGTPGTKTRQTNLGDSTKKTTTPSVEQRSFKNDNSSPKVKGTKGTKAEQELIDETKFINSYLQNMTRNLNKAMRESNIKNLKKNLKILKIKYHSFFFYLENYYDETNATKIDKELLYCVFLHPQFKMKYMNFEKNVFKGSIMVHDLTNWFEKGLTENEKVFGKISMDNNQRLFAISCDERMNFTNDLRDNDSRNNKTKQLCTMFSSDFFDPCFQKDETHVLLIGLGVAGPTKNHVAMLVANKKFEEIVINVHLEPSGQGDKVDSSEYALAELDALLNSICGNNIHPFFKKHKATIKNMRIFSDFNLLSNVIAERLKNFKINKGFKEFKFKLLLDRVKTHDNVKKKKNTYHTVELDEKKVNSGCIDNVIYITKVKSIEEKIQNVIVGNRKLPDEKYTEEVYNSLSDHSSIIIIEDIDTNIDNSHSSNTSDASADEYDLRTMSIQETFAPHFITPNENQIDQMRRTR